jgi:hypothetical protein
MQNNEKNTSSIHRLTLHFYSFQYFLDYKLGPQHTNTGGEYSTYFLHYVGFAAQIPNVLFNWVSVFVQFR